MNTGHLLIIDDDLRHRESVARLVSDAGHEVVGIGAGADAATLLEGCESVDLLLLDLHMPVVDGYDVLTTLRGHDASPAVIILTGRADDADTRRLLRLGADDFLVKPYEPALLLSSISEVLARRAREQATTQLLERVRESDQLYRFLVEQSPDVIYTLDAEGRFSFVSSSAEAVLGRRPETLLGEHWSILFAPGERERARYRFDDRRTGERATRDLELRLAGDDLTKPHWIQISATGLYSPDGPDAKRFDGTYGVVRDVTAARAQEDERVRLEGQLEQARRLEAIGQLAGGIAHDFNNILASMIGYAELAQMDTPEDGPVHQYLNEVVDAGHRARDLIAQLLNFSRSESGEARAVNVRRQVDDVARMLRAVIPTSVSIDIDTDQSDATIRIDPVQFQQVLLNLLINARDAVGSNGRIRIGIREARNVGPLQCSASGEFFSGDYVELEVADDGVGIAPDLLSHLFQPLVTARPSGSGTGFGLALIRSIVHRNSGHIVVESTRGEGTSFRIYLPRTDECVAEPVEETRRTPAPSSRQAHVVVVDDEASVANFLRELLEHAGHRTTVFNDPETALGWLEQHITDVDLVISDQTMPRMTGLQLAEKLSRLRRELPVILCTGYGHEAASPGRPGIAAVLPKPFEIREMLTTVDHHIGSG
ncbi:MAG: response regulator [Pseudomonadales bacterium]|nr:response regulator [Pseudomonadales bacterium]